MSLSTAAEMLRLQECAKLLESSALPDELKHRLEVFSRALTGRIVHQSIVRMREYINGVKFS